MSRSWIESASAARVVSHDWWAYQLLSGAGAAIMRDRAQVLLSEVNHRVANSLALVSSLVNLQGKSIGDSTKLFHQIQGESGAARA